MPLLFSCNKIRFFHGEAQFIVACGPITSNMVCLFVCFVALRHKSTAMVIAGRSVHLTTLFPGQAWTSS